MASKKKTTTKDTTKLPKRGGRASTNAKSKKTKPSY
jgi:hypothetical protein